MFEAMSLKATRISELGHDYHLFVGRLAQDNEVALRQALEVSIREGVFNIVADISKVTYLNELCISVLVSILKQCRENGGTLDLIVDPYSTPPATLETKGMLEMFSNVFFSMDVVVGT